MAIHKARDISMKTILAERELFVQFLRDYVPVDIVKNIDPRDVLDISERFVNMMGLEQKDGDTVKLINLRDTPLFESI